jgi:hypothetical protein
MSTDDTIYTVVARGKAFELSKAQVSFDYPNLLSNSLLGHFAEASSRVLKLDCHPDLFAIIVDYLSGYPILPLRSVMLPERMDTELAMRYLAKDADYLGLTRLHELLCPPETVSTAFEDWALSEKYGADLVDVLKDRLPVSVRWEEDEYDTYPLRDAKSSRTVPIFARNIGLRCASDWGSACFSELDYRFLSGLLWPESRSTPHRYAAPIDLLHALSSRSYGLPTLRVSMTSLSCMESR